MKRIGFIICAAIIGCTSSAYCLDQKQDRRAISDAYKGMVSALSRKDVEGAAQGLTADVKVKGADGKYLTLSQWKAQRARQMVSLSNVRAIFNMRSVVFKNDTADVDCWETILGTELGTDKQKHSLRIVENVKDTWKRLPGGWKLSARVIIKQSEIRDEKPSAAGASKA